jgi:8-oxo-dGTP pyrophosphatase MutT (NUDIX family)
MLWKNVALYEIYSKKLQGPNSFCTSLYICTAGFFFGLRCSFLTMSCMRYNLQQYFIFFLDATAEREVLEETGIKSGQFIYVIMCSIKT